MDRPDHFTPQATLGLPATPRLGSERLGIVTPLANEEDTIETFLDQVLPRLAAEDRVFLVLDNVSRDRTRRKIEDYQDRDPRIALVWAPESRSVVDAYFRGYREAMAAGMDWILEMDGGLSHDPAEIPRFLQAMQSGAEYAGGTRFSLGGRYHGPWQRYAISRGGTFLANLLLGARMRDMTSGFECFSRRAMQYVLDRGVGSRAHFFQTEIRCFMHRFRWVEVPITYRNPSPSVGAGSLLDALRNLWRIRATRAAEVDLLTFAQRMNRGRPTGGRNVGRRGDWPGHFPSKHQ